MFHKAVERGRLQQVRQIFFFLAPYDAQVASKYGKTESDWRQIALNNLTRSNKSNAK